MPPDGQTIFVVDDDHAVRESLRWLLESVNLPVVTFASAQEFLDSYRTEQGGCLILDVRMPGMSGLELQKKLTDYECGLPVIIITGHGDVPMAVRALKTGAVDFIEKPFDPDLIRIKVDKALERQALVRQNQYLRSELTGEYGELVGKSPKTMDLLRTIEKVAPSDSTVLITGGSGTGMSLWPVPSTRTARVSQRRSSS